MIAHDKIYKITTTSENSTLITHSAIAFDYNNTKYVIHMTFDGVEVITLETLLKTRKLLRTKEYKLKQDVQIEDILYNYQGDRFELINNNCETFCNDFINTYTTKKTLRLSEQVIIYTILTAIILTIIIKLNK